MGSTDPSQLASHIEGDSSEGLRIAAPFEPDPEMFSEGGELDDRAFDRELRKRNLPMLLWTAVVFNTAYVGWAFFDYILLPQLWSYFFVFRIIAVGITTTMVFVIFRPRFRRYSFEGFWLLVVIYCTFIAPMLPFAGADFSKYIMGLSVTMVGAGVIPTWHPRWPISPPVYAPAA